MYKEIKIVILPAKEANIAYIGRGMGSDGPYKDIGFCKPQNFYFLSDEEIKDGDWFYNFKDNRIEQYTETIVIIKPQFCKKIIASTNFLIVKETFCRSADSFDLEVYYDKKYLPHPSKEWIEYYISEWKKGNKIEKVMVEYKDWCDYDDDNTWGGCDKPDIRLVVKNNTINIKSIKDNWNREELKPILLKLCHDLDDAIKKEIDNEFKVETWMEQNL